MLLKDDKSFPYIQIRSSHAFPQITKFRGKHNDKDKYFGPFASIGSANWTIKMLQKVFQLRVCDDHTFNNRNRPCILYQIKRCSGPCTSEINQKNYQNTVDECINFLNGKTKDIQKKMSSEMDRESKELNFEKAAILRDRIKSLTYIQSSQNIQKNMKKKFKFVHKTGKVFEDKRGYLLKILDKGFSSSIEIFSKKGTIRANHYHPQQEQKCLFTKGQIIEVFQDIINAQIPEIFVLQERFYLHQLGPQ